MSNIVSDWTSTCLSLDVINVSINNLSIIKMKNAHYALLTEFVVINISFCIFLC